MKVLAVEDERKAAAYLREGLAENGFVVGVAHDDAGGLHRARSGDYDLVILDVMPPGRDGWSALSELRQAGRGTLVLFLTARDAVQDGVKGLELGPTTTSSSRSPFPSCWPGCARCCAAAAP